MNKTVTSITSAVEADLCSTTKETFKNAVKYNACNESEYYQKVRVLDCITELQKTNSQKHIQLGTSIYTKILYDIQIKNRFNYLLSLNDNTGSAHPFEYLFSLQQISPRVFCEALKNILNEEKPKINTLWIYGIPNSGKSLILKMLAEVFITKTFSNIDSTTQFIFGNIVNSSIILIEEPFLMPILLEDFKKICEGSKISVNVKYKEPQTLNRTPIFISSNFSTLSHGHAPGVSEQAIKARCCYFTFNQPFSYSRLITVQDFISFVNKYV